MTSFLLAILNAVAEPPLAKLLAGIVAPVVGFAVVLVYRRYAIIIKRGDPHERRAYAALRQSLAQGGLPARIYSERLKVTLDAVDRFFGDAGMADRTLWPRAFGLRTPAPLWTAASFDRCLLLALLYPIATVYGLWAVSGHVGPAERALALGPDMPGWERLAVLAVTGAAYYCGWRLLCASSWAARLIWGGALAFNFALAVALLEAVSGGGAGEVASIFAIAYAVVVAFAVAFVVAFAVAGVVAGAGAGAFASAFALAVAFACIRPVAVAVSVAVVGSAAVVGAVVVAVVVAVAVVGAVAGAGAGTVAHLNDRAAKGSWQGPFQAGLVIALTAASLAVAGTLGQAGDWQLCGPLLLFVGLLTLFNAPFDWASLGLTRALLRRGLELGGWWPYLLAIADALAAAGVIALLTVVCVFGAQAFNDLAVFSGSDKARVLPLPELFDGIEAHPSAPEFWWVYAMLLSTMIPSFVNLMIGGASLVRGIPWVTKLLLHLMPDLSPTSRSKVPPHNQQWITVLLTAQVFVGAAIGIAAQVFLAYVVIGWFLPLFGLDLLDLARAVAAPDVPGRVIEAVLGAGRG